MNRERRNLYRLLHVQPEAPAEIITAAYRCMMSKLKMHPDLGGNHEIATRLNEAYAILSDPEKRQQYDAQRRVRAAIRSANARSAEPSQGASFTPHMASHARPQAAQSSSPSSTQHSSHTTHQAQPPWSSADRHQCPMCLKSLPRVIATDSRCSHCDSPIAPLAHQIRGQRELLGRRMSNRVARTDSASVQLAPMHPFSPARLRDMSLSGVGLITNAAVHADSIIRIMTDSMDLVAHVVRVRHAAGVYHVHARLLTGYFGKQSGVFVSATA